MAIKATPFWPDTCKCHLYFEWDDELAQEDRTHSLHKIESVCSDHQGLSDNEIFNAIFHENNSKNVALGMVMSNFPALVKQILDQSGNTTNVFISDPIITFDPVQEITPAQSTQMQKGISSPATSQPVSQPAPISARPISMSISGLSQQEMSDCQTLMDNQFGPGVVTIV